ncbi:MAG TPA: hypothetical protein VL201_01415 [Patescibacteria group bacterium]|jgi:hypothetical protein|nr:hypothetical protein [Patescibacteria group bacterium]
MKKVLAILIMASVFFNFFVFGQELFVLPYAYYAGQVYFLFLKAPDRSLTVIQDLLKKDESRVARAAKAFSVETRALWGKYEKDNSQFYKRRPSKNDYYQSISFITEKLEKAPEKGLMMKTDRCVFWFVEVPYIQSDWLQKAPHLSEGLESWFADHQLTWVKMHALFEQKGNEWVVRKNITTGLGQLNTVVKDRLDQFGRYNAEGLSAIVRVKSPFSRVLERSAVRHRKIINNQATSYSPVYGSRLRRSRRTNR